MEYFSHIDNQKYRSQALKVLMRVCNVQWLGEDTRNYIICVLIYDIDQMMQNVQNTEAGLAGQVVMMAVVAESADPRECAATPAFMSQSYLVWILSPGDWLPSQPRLCQ